MKEIYLPNTLRRRGNFSVWPELKEEIQLELAQLRRQLEILAALREKVTETAPDGVEIMALAAFLHAFYNGVENIFKRVSLNIGGDPPRTGSWHTQLLDRMTCPTSARAAVISEGMRDALQGYLDFRHMFRHSYSFELQWSKMAPLVLEVESTLQRLEEELGQFLQAIESRGEH